MHVIYSNFKLYNSVKIFEGSEEGIRRGFQIKEALGRKGGLGADKNGVGVNKENLN